VETQIKKIEANKSFSKIANAPKLKSGILILEKLKTNQPIKHKLISTQKALTEIKWILNVKFKNSVEKTTRLLNVNVLFKRDKRQQLFSLF